MVTWVESILETPLPSLLVIAGLVFLGVAVVGQVSGKIDPGREGRVLGGAVGAVLLVVGLVMSLGGLPVAEADNGAATEAPTEALRGGANGDAMTAVSTAAVTRAPTDTPTDRPTDTPTAVPPTETPAGATQLPSEDCLAFSTDAVTVRADGERWLLTDGRSRMAVFDVRTEASRTLEVIREYGLDDHCFIGRPGASLEYWLADDRAPRGPMAGEDCTPFDPANLRPVANSAGGTTLADGSHLVMAFPNREEAAEALAVIRHHGFTRYCFVGRPDPSMTYLRR